VLPLGNISLGVAVAYSIAALAWIVATWRRPEQGLYAAAGPLLATLGAAALLPLVFLPVRNAVWRGIHAALAVLVAGIAAGLGGAALPLSRRHVPELGVTGSEDAGAVVTALLAGLAARPELLIAALVLGVGGALANASDDAGETADMLDLAREKHAADADLERLLDRPAVRRELARCQGYSVSGSGRAAAAALLERDPSEVPISRAPIPQSGRAAVSTARSVPLGTPDTIRVGAWEFVDRC
jgi:hypothetical protein